MNVTSPETTRQMANSYLFTPWDSIEREIILESSVGARRAFGTSKQVAKQIYEGLTRVWTFDALVRPMYIVKQSLLEPYISASLALGPMAAAKIGVTATANSFRNNIIQKPGGVASKLVNRKDLKAVNRRVTSNQRILNTLVAQKDHLSATIDDMLKAGSPAARQQNVPKLKKYLGAIDELVEKAELNLIESMAPLGKMPKINNAPSLRRRIDYIEKNLSPAELAKVQPQITAAKNGLSKYYAAVAKMATNGKVIKDIDDSLMKSYDEIDNVDQFVKTTKSRLYYICW
jgi:hypothetical protein